MEKRIQNGMSMFPLRFPVGVGLNGPNIVNYLIPFGDLRFFEFSMA